VALTIHAGVWSRSPVCLRRDGLFSYSPNSWRQCRTPQASIGRTVLFSQQYPMPKFSAVLPTQHTTGDFEEMCLAAGESAGLVKDIKPAGEIVHEMMDEAKRIVEARLVPLVGGGTAEGQ
jgi:hypothetical protein